MEKITRKTGTFFVCTVAYENVEAKKVKEPYVIDAQSFAEAEAKVLGEMDGFHDVEIDDLRVVGIVRAVAVGLSEEGIHLLLVQAKGQDGCIPHTTVEDTIELHLGHVAFLGGRNGVGGVAFIADVVGGDFCRIEAEAIKAYLRTVVEDVVGLARTHVEGVSDGRIGQHTPAMGAGEAALAAIGKHGVGHNVGRQVALIDSVLKLPFHEVERVEAYKVAFNEGCVLHIDGLQVLN